MHDLPGEHGHDDAPEFEDEEESPFWKIDTITLTSVGIDVGTATSQIIFSRLFLRRLGRELSSRFVVTERDTLYLSPIHFTPYTANRERIDDQALGRIVDQAYQEAGLTPEAVDTGAIILTGEAIRRDNARAIADLFAEQRGNFVCASAGHNFEAILAAHGSGAVALSGENHSRVLNIDIGGGTTKLTVIDKGRVEQTAALHIGGRLLARDQQGLITLLEPGGAVLAQHAGFDWKIGDRVTDGEVDKMTDWMAGAVMAAVTQDQPASEVADLFVTPMLHGVRNYDAVVFSGGVGEYVYGKEARSFGDLGASLGQALQARTSNGGFPWPLAPAQECIRATVMGASQYTVQVSGNTIFHSNDGLLPKKNLQVLRPVVDLSDDIHAEAVAKAIATHFRHFDLEEGEADVALVFSWDGPPMAQRLGAFCQGLIQGLPKTMDQKKPVFLVFDRDLGGLVGAILKEDFNIPSDVLSIDGVTLHDFDFIDLGRVLEPSGTVPVTIKSLVFQM